MPNHILKMIRNKIDSIIYVRKIRNIEQLFMLLLTGATGFVGKNILPILNKEFDVKTLGLSELNDYSYDLSKDIPSSKDNTLDIVKEYESKFNGRLKWISENDKGIYDAMNKGIGLASGEVVGILNSDDFFTDNNVLSDIIDCFEKHNVDSLFANLYFVKQDDTSKIVRVWKGSPYKENGFKKGWHPSHPTFYVKNDIYKKYGVFDLNFDVSADFELMLRFIEKYKISTYYLDRFTVKMRYGGESTGSISKIILGNKNILRAFKKNGIKVSFFYPIIRLVPKVLEFIKK